MIDLVIGGMVGAGLVGPVGEGGVVCEVAGSGFVASQQLLCLLFVVEEN